MGRTRRIVGWRVPSCSWAWAGSGNTVMAVTAVPDEAGPCRTENPASRAFVARSRLHGSIPRERTEPALGSFRAARVPHASHVCGVGGVCRFCVLDAGNAGCGRLLGLVRLLAHHGRIWWINGGPGPSKGQWRRRTRRSRGALARRSLRAALVLAGGAGVAAGGSEGAGAGGQRRWERSALHVSWRRGVALGRWWSGGANPVACRSAAVHVEIAGWLGSGR